MCLRNQNSLLCFLPVLKGDIFIIVSVVPLTILFEQGIRSIVSFYYVATNTSSKVTWILWLHTAEKLSDNELNPPLYYLWEIVITSQIKNIARQPKAGLKKPNAFSTTRSTAKGRPSRTPFITFSPFKQ